MQAEPGILSVFGHDLKGVFLDFGNTVIDEGPFIRGAQIGAVRFVRQMTGIKDDDNDLLGKLLSTPRRAVRTPGMDRLAFEQYHVRKGWMADFARSCGLEVDADMADRIMEAYDCGAKESDCLIGDMQFVLRELSRRYRLYIVSNGYAGFVHATLAHYDLTGYFDQVIVSQEAGAEKPDPAIYNLALGHCGLKPEEIMMVGDGYEPDIRGAAAMGMKTCWINPEKKTPPGSDHDLVIEHLGQLV